MNLRSFFPALVSVSVLFMSVTACTVSPEKSAAYIKMKKRLAKLEESQENTRDSIGNIYFDVDTLNQDNATLKATLKKIGPSGQVDSRLAEVKKRLDSLEQQLKSVHEALAAQKKMTKETLAVLEKKPARSHASRVSAKSKGGGGRTTASTSGKRSRSRKADSVSTSRRSSRRAASRAGAARTKPKPRGFYYQTQPGDTIHSVARAHNVSSSKLCHANRIPLSALLYAGQHIYIPRT